MTDFKNNKIKKVKTSQKSRDKNKQIKPLKQVHKKYGYWSRLKVSMINTSSKNYMTIEEFWKRAVIHLPLLKWKI